jgi:hypothetical protein
MFRDESSKVIKKAHAQWTGDPGQSSNDSLSQPNTSEARRRQPSAEPNAECIKMIKSIDGTITDRAAEFYLQNFLFGYPNEPKTGADININTDWISAPGVSDVMAAVGMVALGNLRSDGDMVTAAREKYILVLQQTSKSLQDIKSQNFYAMMRSVVILAMFEVSPHIMMPRCL